MPNKPRSFKEVVAAQDPAEQARLANAESFEDVTVSNPFHRLSRAMENCPLGATRNCPLLG